MNGGIEVGGEADADDIAAPGLSPDIGETVDEIDGMVVEGGFHAEADDANREQGELENDDGRHHQHGQTQQRAFGPPSDGRDAQPIPKTARWRFIWHDKQKSMDEPRRSNKHSREGVGKQAWN